MNDVIRVEAKGEICAITLNHPESGNALSDAAISRLGDVLAAVDPAAKFITIQGAGGDFCVGRAAPAPGAHKKAMEAMELRRAHDIVFRVYGLIRNAPVPVVAIVRGRALGFGFALAAVSDITIAAADATFQIPEFAHSIMPTMVMSAMIDRVPLKAAIYHVYSTEPFNAAEALRIGAVSAVVPGDELDTKVGRISQNLLSAPTPARLAVKEFARNAQAIDMNKTVEYARAFHALVNSSSEMQKK